jgi:ankyrin repeat protein
MEDILKEQGRLLICEWAAGHGRLDVLTWAREQGCPWNTCTCDYAAIHGHLNCLKYARENGCPCDILTSKFAIRNNHLHILVYLIEHGCDINKSWKCKLTYKCFTYTTKIVSHNLFIHQDLVYQWIQLIDRTLNELFYNDLSILIKSFI